MADILVVDDDQDIAETVAEILRTLGHAVRIAANGADGLALVAEKLPDLLVLDVEMPVLDGPAMAHRMLIEDLGRENVPIVLLSGVADFARAVAFVGTPYALRKPTGLTRLIATVNLALTERTAPSHRAARERQRV